MGETVLWISLIIGIVAGVVQVLDYLHNHIGLRLPYKKQKLFINGKLKSKELIPNKNVNINDCEAPVINGFGQVWNESQEVRNILECPPSISDIEKSTEIGVLYFRSGVIVWLMNDGDSESVIYILFDDDKSFYRIRFNIDSSKNTENLAKILKQQFETIYWSRTDLQVRQRLGEEIRSFTMSSGAFQKFQNGRMFWIGSTNDIIIVFENYPHSKLLKQWRRFKDVVWWN